MNSEWFKELWRHRELLYFLAWRDTKVRYKQAALGVAWAVIQPLFTMIVFTLFFGRLAKIPSDGVPYPIFSYCALVPWTYFSVALGLGGNSLVTNANLVTKVYFPRAVLPASTAVSGLVDFAVGSLFLAVLMVYYHVPPSWRLLWIPVCIAALVLFTTGATMVLAAMNVRYRDIKYAIPFMVQLWLFVTPVIYPISMLPKRMQALAALNPLSGIIEGFRTCVFRGHRLDPVLTAVSLGSALAVFLLGAVYFRRAERSFADVV